MFTNTFKRKRNTVIATLATLVLLVYVIALLLRLIITYHDDVMWIVSIGVVLVVAVLAVPVVMSGKEDFEYIVDVSKEGITFVLFDRSNRRVKANNNEEERLTWRHSQEPSQIFITRPFKVIKRERLLKISDGRTTLIIPYTKGAYERIKWAADHVDKEVVINKQSLRVIS